MHDDVRGGVRSRCGAKVATSGVGVSSAGGRGIRCREDGLLANGKWRFAVWGTSSSAASTLPAPMNPSRNSLDWPGQEIPRRKPLQRGFWAMKNPSLDACAP